MISSGQSLMSKSDMCQFQVRAFNYLGTLQNNFPYLKVSADDGFSVGFGLEVKRPWACPPLDQWQIYGIRRNDPLVQYIIQIWELFLTEA